MDQGEGKFTTVPDAIADVITKMHERAALPADPASLWPRLFRTGEEIEIRQSRFVVEYIGSDVLVLKLMMRQGKGE